jgi:hypothetical protein
MIENMEFSLTKEQIAKLDEDIQDTLTKAAAAEGVDVKSMAHLCWRNDPLRDLDSNNPKLTRMQMILSK